MNTFPSQNGDGHRRVGECPTKPPKAPSGIVFQSVLTAKPLCFVSPIKLTEDEALIASPERHLGACVACINQVVLSDCLMSLHSDRKKCESFSLGNNVVYFLHLWMPRQKPLSEDIFHVIRTVHVGFLIVQTGQFEMLSKKPFAKPQWGDTSRSTVFLHWSLYFFSVEYNSDF